jgi:cobalamin biosynthesis protein CobD/CbiB
MHGWGVWDSSWLWSLALVAITIAIHAAGVVLIGNAIEWIKSNLFRQGFTYLDKAPGTIALMVAVALSLGVFHAIESLLWAIVYVWLGALPSPADAALYSVDSMTTRGASGLQLDRQWRMMGATEAGDGMLLFGISTAFLFYVMQRLWMQRLLKSDFHGTS